LAHADDIDSRAARLALPFNRFGYDPYGISRKHIAWGMHVFRALYRTYFRVKTFGAENVPARGRAMLVGNHSGGVAMDGAMVIAAMFLELEPPRLAQGMVEKFINQFPFASQWASRTGQFTGLKGELVSLADSLDGCERIIRDEFKDYPESALYMIGAIDEAKGKPKNDKPKPEPKPQPEVEHAAADAHAS